MITKDTPGVPDENTSPGPGEWESFGGTVATGDVTGDGIADVLVGDHGNVEDGLRYVGSVTLLLGRPGGLTGVGAMTFMQRPPGGPVVEAGISVGQDPGEEFDALGASVAILNLDGTGPLEMIVGVPHEAIPGDVESFPHGMLTQLQMGIKFQVRRAPGAPSPTIPTGDGQFRRPEIALLETDTVTGLEWSVPQFTIAGLGFTLLAT